MSVHAKTQSRRGQSGDPWTHSIRISLSMTLEFLLSGGNAAVTERAIQNPGTLIYTHVSARV